LQIKTDRTIVLRHAKRDRVGTVAVVFLMW